MTAEQKKIKELEAEVKTLKGLVKDLLDRIDKLQNRKNSRNSSVPPSKDENRPKKTKSLRTKSGKKPGGQYGHEGNTLKMVEDPDEIIEHKAKACNICGTILEEKKQYLISRRQVVDIPPIEPYFIEHRIYLTVCNCGHENTGSYPDCVKAPISYGSNIEALAVYLHTRQYVASERICEFFKDTCNLPFSEGSIYNIIERFTQRAMPLYERIKQAIVKSRVVGSDETGVKIDGKMNWGWTWQNNHATFITVSPNRGPQTISQTFTSGIPGAVLVHDCWKPHFKTGTSSHQLCLAHILRELKYLEERYRQIWTTRVRELFIDAFKFKKKLKRFEYYYPLQERTKLENRLDELIQQDLSSAAKDIIKMQNRLCKYRDYIFKFLYHPDVPPDNNASERAIRNLKVKLKVSGQFKSMKGAQCFAVLRSITDTCIKNKQNVLQALRLIAQS
ncbi:MAG: IS66 family transposase [Bacteroidota bacterium]